MQRHLPLTSGAFSAHTYEQYASYVLGRTCILQNIWPSIYLQASSVTEDVCPSSYTMFSYTWPAGNFCAISTIFLLVLFDTMLVVFLCLAFPCGMGLSGIVPWYSTNMQWRYVGWSMLETVKERFELNCNSEKWRRQLTGSISS